MGWWLARGVRVGGIEAGRGVGMEAGRALAGWVGGGAIMQQKKGQLIKLGLNWFSLQPGAAPTLPVARHAKRGLIWVKPALNNCQGLFWAGVARDQTGFGQSG